MLSIDDIVASLTTTRADFAELFLQAQSGLENRQRKPFDVVTSQPDDTAAFKEALTHAQLRGFLDDFINLVVSSGLENGRLAGALVRASGTQEAAELQAMADQARGYVHPDVWQRGFANATRWTVRILIDGEFQGSGILVGPNLVLTAWHVVRSLFISAGGRLEPDPAAGTSNRLTFEFDDFLTLVGRSDRLIANPPRRAAAHRAWCVKFSDCHAEELMDRLPADTRELDSHWDYALLRLSPPPGIERRWAPLNPTAVVPKCGEPAVVFQYPAGQRMKADPGTIEAIEPPTPAIPRFRFLHNANAGPGSSGGPCFDKEFELFGLHQGVWQRGGNGQRVLNRGVPIVRVLEHVGPLPALDPSEAPIWNLGPAHNYTPVFGTEKFQAMVWRSLSERTPRLILIGGEKESGKTFCLDLLSTMLAEGAHLKIVLSAGIIGKQDPGGIAAAICSAASAPLEPITPVEQYASTVGVWLRDHVVGNIVRALDGVRNRRTVWLCIRELNHFDVDAEHASDLLHLLYEETRGNDWLRIVLDGMQADVPQTVVPLTDRYDAAEPTLKDVMTAVSRFNGWLKLGMPVAFVNAISKPAFDNFVRDRWRGQAMAMKALAEDVMAHVNAALELQQEDP